MRYIILVLLFIASPISYSKELTENLQAAGFTKLHAFAWNGDIKEMERHILDGVSINIASNSGITPLHSAVTEGQLDSVVYLIQKGANIESKDIHGRTPLFLPVEGGDSPKKIIDILVNAGADLSVKNKWGKSLSDAAWHPEAKNAIDEYKKVNSSQQTDS